ncbi:MAG: hypothetical protein WBW88_02255 [Rhodothermales bacterium]
MTTEACKPPSRIEGTRPCDPRRSIVSVVLASVLMLYQVPLVPLLGIVLHPGMRHAPCTAVMCHCMGKCKCRHHMHERDAMRHNDADSSERPSLHPCGGEGSASMFVVPALDKALLSKTADALPRVLPPMRFVHIPVRLSPKPFHDIFHPPRWA